MQNLCDKIIQCLPATPATPPLDDSIRYAHEMGRLDLVTVLLTCIGIILAIGGLLAYCSIRRSAQEAAKEVAEGIAETAANNYLQAKLPEILEAYREFIRDGVNEEVANQIALAQDDGANQDEQ